MNSRLISIRLKPSEIQDSPEHAAEGQDIALEETHADG